MSKKRGQTKKDKSEEKFQKFQIAKWKEEGYTKKQIEKFREAYDKIQSRLDYINDPKTDLDANIAGSATASVTLLIPTTKRWLKLKLWL